jgi:hypothetical protein
MVSISPESPPTLSWICARNARSISRAAFSSARFSDAACCHHKRSLREDLLIERAFLRGLLFVQSTYDGGAMIAAAREEVFVLLLCVLCLLVRVGRGGRLALLPAKK